MKRSSAIKNIFLTIFLNSALLSSSGCVYLAVGSIGAVGGYVVSPDTVEGTVEKDYEEVWDTSMDVLNIMGRIVNQHEKEGKIEAIVHGARVNVNLAQYPNRRLKVSVKARKSFFPKILIAQDVYIKILNRLVSHGS